MAGVGRRTPYRKHLTDSVWNDCPEPLHNERIARVVATRGSNQFDVQLAKDEYEEYATDITSGDAAASGSSSSSVILTMSSPVDKGATATTATTEIGLAILPAKFRTLVWVKRNDFVIVQCAEDDTVEDDGDDGADEDKEETTTTTTAKKNNNKKKKEEKDATDDDDDVDARKLSAHHNNNNSNSVRNKNNSVSSKKDINYSNKKSGGGIRFIICHILYKDQIHHLLSRGLWPTHDPDFNTTTNHPMTLATHSENEDVATKTSSTYNANWFGPSDQTNKEKNINDKQIHGIDAIYDDAYGNSYDKDLIEEDDNDEDEVLFVNTNRIAKVALEDSSSEEEDND